VTEPAVPQLDLLFERRAGRTVLAHRHVSYPFYVTAPLGGRGPGSEVIVQSVSGGLFGGERIAQQVTLGDRAEVVIRMPSATVVHDRRGKTAPSQSLVLRPADGARLLYLPRPLILLPGSGLVQSTDIMLGRQSEVLMQESFLMHNPAGLPPAARALDSRVTIRDLSGRLLALDRMRVTDELLAAAAPGVAGGYRAFGTVWLLCEGESDAYRQLKAALSLAQGDTGASYLAMTPLRAGIGAMVRIAARDGGDLDAALTMIWRMWTHARCIAALRTAASATAMIAETGAFDAEGEDRGGERHARSGPC